MTSDCPPAVTLSPHLLLAELFSSGDGMQCVSGNDFFDDNLRISNGSAKFVGLCPER